MALARETCFSPNADGAPKFPGRVFCALDATVFARGFGGWMADISEALGLNGLTHIAIDGKSLRGATGNTFTGRVHMMKAWATGHGLVLGREVVADKSNEIPAFPELLKTLKLKGTLCESQEWARNSVVHAIGSKRPSTHQCSAVARMRLTGRTA